MTPNKQAKQGASHLIVLELLSDRGTLKSAELVAAIKIQRSSIGKVLLSMARLGWVERTGASGGYRYKITSSGINALENETPLRGFQETTYTSEIGLAISRLPTRQQLENRTTGGEA